MKNSDSLKIRNRVTAEPKENKSLKGEIEMPEFGSPFSGLAKDRKLSDAELIRAIRFMISAKT